MSAISKASENFIFRWAFVLSCIDLRAAMRSDSLFTPYFWQLFYMQTLMGDCQIEKVRMCALSTNSCRETLCFVILKRYLNHSNNDKLQTET
jgi:hypothetical protein